MKKVVIGLMLVSTAAAQSSARAVDKYECEMLADRVEFWRESYNDAKANLRSAESFRDSFGRDPLLGPGVSSHRAGVEAARDDLNGAIEAYTMSGCGGSRMNSTYDNLNY